MSVIKNSVYNTLFKKLRQNKVVATISIVQIELFYDKAKLADFHIYIADFITLSRRKYSQ